MLPTAQVGSNPSDRRRLPLCNTQYKGIWSPHLQNRAIYTTTCQLLPGTFQTPDSGTLDKMTIPAHQSGFGYKKGSKKIQRYDDIVIRQPKGSQVLLKIEAAGLCSSDLHILWGQDPRVPDKFIMGHEVAGQIIAVGSDLLEDPIYKVGGRFALSIADSCGSCANCRVGHDGTCLKADAFGLNQDGGFQQYLLISNLRVLLPIPDGVPYEVAAVSSDAVLTPFLAIRKAKDYLIPGAKVLLFGLGGLGIHALQILKQYGVYVVACDIKPESKDMAFSNGADEYYSNINDSKHKPESFDVCFDFVGFQPTFDGCQKYVRDHGLIVIVGLGKRKFEMFNYELSRRSIQIKFSFGGSSQEQIECMKWVAEGRIKTVLKVVDLKELPNKLDDLAKGKIVGRIVFDPAKL